MMTPQEQLEYARKQADLFYAPSRAELEHQQLVLHTENLAEQKTIQEVYRALAGMESGPYGQIAGQEGTLEYLKALQEVTWWANKT